MLRIIEGSRLLTAYSKRINVFLMPYESVSVKGTLFTS